MLVIDSGDRARDPDEILSEFITSRAEKLFFFRPPQVPQTFVDMVLDIDRNLLDRSIVLPYSFQTSGPDRFRTRIGNFSLFVLDKARIRDGRTEITFTDASSVKVTKICGVMAGGNREELRKLFKVLSENFPTTCKDFREIIIRKEPILPTFQIMKLRGSFVPLQKCATLCRVPPYTRSAVEPAGDGNEDSPPPETVEMNCLSPKHFASYGYTTPPPEGDRKLFPAGKIKEDRHLLRGSDILIIVQSNIGKICIIDPAFSKTAWTASSFTVIIRPKDPGKLDPRVLYMYLASKAVKQYLTSCASGGAVPLIHGEMLNNLPVPVFSDSEKENLTKNFEKLEAIRRSVDRLNSIADGLLTKNCSPS